MLGYFSPGLFYSLLLRWCGHRAHLLQKAQCIPLAPLPALNNPTVLQPMDPHAGHVDRFAGRGDA